MKATNGQALLAVSCTTSYSIVAPSYAGKICWWMQISVSISVYSFPGVIALALVMYAWG